MVAFLVTDWYNVQLILSKTPSPTVQMSRIHHVLSKRGRGFQLYIPNMLIVQKFFFTPRLQTPNPHPSPQSRRSDTVHHKRSAVCLLIEHPLKYFSAILIECHRMNYSTGKYFLFLSVLIENR